jgi:hypothetical protein
LFLTLRDIKMNTCRDSHGIWSGRLREAGWRKSRYKPDQQL